MLSSNKIDPMLRLKLYIHQIVDDNINIRKEEMGIKGLNLSEQQEETLRIEEWAKVEKVVVELKEIYGQPTIVKKKPVTPTIDRNIISDNEIAKVKHLRLAGHSFPYIAFLVGKEEALVKECVRAK